MTSIAPCLWFDRNAEEAARFYVSLIPDFAHRRRPPFFRQNPGRIARRRHVG